MFKIKWMRFAVLPQSHFKYAEFRVSLIFINKENLVNTSPTTMQWIICLPLETDSKYLNSNRRYSYSNKGTFFWDTWKSCFLHRTNYQCSFDCTVLIWLWGIKNIEDIFRKRKSWREKWNKLKHCTRFQTGDSYKFLNLHKKLLKQRKVNLCAVVFLPLLSSQFFLILILEEIIWNCNQQQFMN